MIRRSLASGVLACTLLPALPFPNPQYRPPSPEALGRPWDIRYVLVFLSDESWASNLNSNPKSNQRRNRDNLPLLWEHLAKPHNEFNWINRPERDHGAKLLLLRFASSGDLMPSSSWLNGRGYFHRLSYIVFESEKIDGVEGEANQLYFIGNWFTGLGDISTHWAPAICDYDDTPHPFSKDSPSYRYGPKYSGHEYQGTFGCREWAYQLYDPGRPYIDVTSYMPRHVESDYRTYIRDFIGWARFGDKKPVIGRHGDDWYCLFDCPNDEPPGHIPDIKLWAAKNGWPAPKPPTRSPTFPDPPLKQGTYP